MVLARGIRRARAVSRHRCVAATGHVRIRLAALRARRARAHGCSIARVRAAYLPLRCVSLLTRHLRDRRLSRCGGARRPLVAGGPRNDMELTPRTHRFVASSPRGSETCWRASCARSARRTCASARSAGITGPLAVGIGRLRIAGCVAGIPDRSRSSTRDPTRLSTTPARHRWRTHIDPARTLACDSPANIRVTHTRLARCGSRMASATQLRDATGRRPEFRRSGHAVPCTRTRMARRWPFRSTSRARAGSARLSHAGSEAPLRENLAAACWCARGGARRRARHGIFDPTAARDVVIEAAMTPPTWPPTRAALLRLFRVVGPDRQAWRR